MGPEAIYGMAIIQVVGLIYFIFPIIHTAQPGEAGGWLGGYKGAFIMKLKLQGSSLLGVSPRSPGQFLAICGHTPIA